MNKHINMYIHMYSPKNATMFLTSSGLKILCRIYFTVFFKFNMFQHVSTLKR